MIHNSFVKNIVDYNQIVPSSGHGKAIHWHIIFLHILIPVLSCSLQIEKRNIFLYNFWNLLSYFSTISETHFHILYKFNFSKILRTWFHWEIFLYNFCNLFSSLYNFWNLLSSLYNFYLSTNLNTPLTRGAGSGGQRAPPPDFGRSFNHISTRVGLLALHYLPT